MVQGERVSIDRERRQTRPRWIPKPVCLVSTEGRAKKRGGGGGERATSRSLSKVVREASTAACCAWPGLLHLGCVHAPHHTSTPASIDRFTESRSLASQFVSRWWWLLLARQHNGCSSATTLPHHTDHHTCFTTPLPHAPQTIPQPPRSLTTRLRGNREPGRSGRNFSIH